MATTPRRLLFLLVLPSLFLLATTRAQDLDDVGDEFGDAVLDLDDLTGKDREKAILNLAATKDPDDAFALVSVLAEPKQGDAQETLKTVFQALMRLKSRETSEELMRVMSSPDPILQGYGFRIYARTYGAKAARELLSKISTAQATAKTDLIIALRDCPSPMVRNALHQLIKKGGASVTVYLTLLRLGDASYSSQILNYYGQASAGIRQLREALIYPSDKRKAARDRVHMRKLIEEKADVRQELAQLPQESIPVFAEAAAKIHQGDVWSLLARMVPKLLNDETVVLFAPLMGSPSIELSTLVLEAIAGSKAPSKAEALRPAVQRFAESDIAELRKQAVRYSDVLSQEARIALTRKLLDDPDKWVRIECIEKLADWKVTDVKNQIDAILKSTEDPDLQWSAEYAITKLGKL